MPRQSWSQRVNPESRSGYSAAKIPTQPKIRPTNCYETPIRTTAGNSSASLGSRSAD